MILFFSTTSIRNTTPFLIWEDSVSYSLDPKPYRIRNGISGLFKSSPSLACICMETHNRITSKKL